MSVSYGNEAATDIRVDVLPAEHFCGGEFNQSGAIRPYQ